MPEIIFLFIAVNFLIFLEGSAFNIDTKSPIIYRFPSHPKRSGYFGFSVALRPSASNYFNSSWIVQIGAPRGNVSTVDATEPGNIYRCHFSGPCSSALLNRDGNQYHFKKRGNARYKVFSERLDYSWLGVAMDVSSTLAGDISVSCGHHWTYQAVSRPLGLDHDNYLAVGACYLEFLSSNEIKKLVPLKNEARAYVMPWFGGVLYDWGLGLAGMSVKMSNSSLILGAPCIYHWTGSIISYSLDDFDNPLVGEIAKTKEMSSEQYTYTGYDVEIGKFFGNGIDWLAIGSPKYGSLHGQVFITRLEKSNERANYRIHSWIKGTQLGEYFGAKLAVLDVNSDGFDDLLVSAPMHSNRFVDQGKVYMFLGSSKKLEPFVESSVTLEGTAAGGRFGTSIVVGDFNQDNHPDIFIGAPYENENRGAVYVYQFLKNTGHPILSQKILAADIDSTLRGFGFSFSRPVDCDGDLYLDVAVGSYLSEDVVLLRSQPVINFQIDFKNLPTFLDRKANGFNFSACITYSGNNPPAIVETIIFLKIDRELDRAYFSRNSQNSLEISTKLQVSKHVCIPISISLNAANILNNTYHIPVKLTAECSLPLITNSSANIIWSPSQKELPKVAPIVTQQYSEKVSDIFFAGECGLDNVCQSDLQLECDFLNLNSDVFYLGSQKEVQLLVTVLNSAESALNTRIMINPAEIPGFSDFDSIKIHCVSENECFYKMETLDENSQKSAIFHINTDSWKYLSDPLFQFNVSVKTDSENKYNSEGTSCSLILKLKNNLAVNLFSSASPATITISNKGESVVFRNFSHTYEIQGVGTSEVKEVSIDICIPTTITIESETFNFSYFHFSQKSENIQENSFAINVNEEDTSKFTSRLDLNGEFAEESNKTYFINCSSTNVNNTVISHKSSQLPMFLEIELFLNATLIEDILKNYDVIKFSTNGTAYTTYFLKKRAELTSIVTSTSFLKDIIDHPVSIKMILLSVIGGLLLIAIIMPVLIKEGFFKRETKERMEALKNQDLIEERFSIHNIKELNMEE